MTLSSYAELNQKMILHFQNKEYAQALDLVITEGENFPAQRPLIEYWKMCAAARLDKREQVYEIAEKNLSEGLWYGEVMWRQTPSFQSLQGDATFEKIVSASLAIQDKEIPLQKPVVIEQFPDAHSENSPLLIALHGNQSTASDTLPFWQAAVSNGFVLAVPQSSQAIFKGAYVWDSVDASFEQIKSCYENLKKDIRFNQNKVFLAGHSMGGLIAIQMALTGELQVSGLILNGPALPFGNNQEEFDKFLPLARENRLRVYFIIGEKDVDIEQDAVKALAERMKSAGIVCELEIVPNMTHDYNPAYDAPFVRGLNFINP